MITKTGAIGFELNTSRIPASKAEFLNHWCFRYEFENLKAYLMSISSTFSEKPIKFPLKIALMTRK